MQPLSSIKHRLQINTYCLYNSEKCPQSPVALHRPLLLLCPPPFLYSLFFYKPTSTVSSPGITLQTPRSSNCICQGHFLRMIPLITALFFGFASAQKVIQLTYCSIDEHHLRMDCKYSVPAESSEVYCKYTQGERLFDTTFPDEEQHAPWRTRAKVRLFPGNICRFLFKTLPNGKSNFTCNIKTPESNMVSKTSVVEKRLLLPCSAWSVLLQSCNGLLLTLMALPLLLGITWL